LCTTSRLVQRIFENQTRFDAVRTRLLEQIDRGSYSKGSFLPGRQFRIAIDLMFARVEMPDHAWIDALPINAFYQEKLRDELVAAGVFSPQPHQTRRHGVLVQSQNGCAVGNIESAFRGFPHLDALRDHYLAKLESGDARPSDFRTNTNALWAYVRRLGDGELPLEQRAFEELPTHAVVRNLRGDLVDCGLLPAKGPNHICVIPNDRRRPTKRICVFCAARRRLKRLIGDRPALEPLYHQLAQQIDRGIYEYGVFLRAQPLGRTLHSLRDLKTAPTDAWLESIDLKRFDRERIREEFVASGLFEPHPLEHRYAKRNLAAGTVSLRGCEHGQVGCPSCNAVRRLEAIFSNYPALAPLRDRFITQLKDKFYRPRFFRGEQNPLWEFVRAVGSDQTRIDTAWLGRQPRSYVLRAFHSELIACGLLEAPVDHIEVARLEVWLADFVANTAGLRDEDRIIIDRFCRLWVMKSARTRLNRRDDHALGVVYSLQNIVRRAVDLGVLVASKNQTLRTFEQEDVKAFPSKRLNQVRPFIWWLKRNGITKITWIPRGERVLAGYLGQPLYRRREIMRRLVRDETVPIDVRVLGLLAVFGLTLVQLAPLRASDVLDSDHIRLNKKRYPVHEDVGVLLRRLQSSVLEATANTRPAGWDPWLFAGPDAIEAPGAYKMTTNLLSVGVTPRRMRNDTIRLTSLDPTVRFAVQRALGRAKGTAGRHLNDLSGKAGTYAALIATMPLDESKKI
jgi:hypothetical protein